MPRGGKRHVPNDVFAVVIKKFLLSEKFMSLGIGTQGNYRRLLQLAESPDGLGGVPVEEMRPALVQAFLDGLSDKPGAQMNAKTSLKTLEKWAIVRDLLPRPITTGTETLGSDGGHEPWSSDHVDIAERTASPHLSRVISLAANTGQRGSDLIRMRWTDVEDHHGHPGINVTPMKLQGRLKIWVPFTQALIQKMATWERRPGFIVLNFDGQPFHNRHQLSNQWNREREKLGLEAVSHLRLHGLRATAVVRLRRAGVSVPLISDMVGMSEKMVARYCRLSDQKENALAAVHILDRTAIEQERAKRAKSTE